MHEKELYLTHTFENLTIDLSRSTWCVGYAVVLVWSANYHSFSSILRPKSQRCDLHAHCRYCALTWLIVIICYVDYKWPCFGFHFFQLRCSVLYHGCAAHCLQWATVKRPCLKVRGLKKEREVYLTIFGVPKNSMLKCAKQSTFGKHALFSLMFSVSCRKDPSS